MLFLVEKQEAEPFKKLLYRVLYPIIVVSQNAQVLFGILECEESLLRFLPAYTQVSLMLVGREFERLQS